MDKVQVWPRTHHITAFRCCKCNNFLSASIVEKVEPDAICGICHEGEAAAAAAANFHGDAVDEEEAYDEDSEEYADDWSSGTKQDIYGIEYDDDDDYDDDDSSFY